MEKVFEYWKEYGMDIIHVKKTLFSVINRSTVECEPLTFDNLTIPYKDNYCYLGSFFTADGKISSVIKKHIESKTPDINKFIIFCAVNTSIPFYIKNQVFDSCIISWCSGFSTYRELFDRNRTEDTKNYCK